MSLFMIAWRSIQHRGFGSALSIFSMALGVMLLVAVLCAHSVISRSFRKSSSFGYGAIVGARGGNLQLTLNTVFYLDRPTGNIPYEYFLEFKDSSYREAQFKNSISYRNSEAIKRTSELSTQLTPGIASPFQSLANHWQQELLQKQWKARSELDRPTRLSGYTKMAIPLALGDYWSPVDQQDWDDNMIKYRVVGTTPELFSELELDVDTQEKLQLAAGRAFVADDPENRFFECVMGSRAAESARQSGLELGDAIYPIHGDPGNSGAHIHDQGFRVVGFLEPTGTPHDRAVYINIEGFFLMEDHVKPLDDGTDIRREVQQDDEGEEPDPFDDMLGAIQPAQLQSAPAHNQVALPLQSGDNQEFDDSETGSGDEASAGSQDPREFELKVDPIPLPIEQREVTSILVRTDPEKDPFNIGNEFILNGVNGNNLESILGWSDYRPPRSQVNDAASAVNPVYEVTKLFAYFVNPVQQALLALTILICVVSGVSIIVGIYNSMLERKKEIAVMRALGASRFSVTTIMLLETAILSLAGGACGWFAGHLLIWLFSGTIEDKTGIRMGLFSVAPVEALVLPGLLLAAILFGLIPAIMAYRTDVSRSLSD